MSRSFQHRWSSGALVAAVVGGLGAPATADDVMSVSEPPVVVPADDTHTHARVSRTKVRLGITLAWLGRYGAARSAPVLTWFDVGFGPILDEIPLREASLGSLAHWSWRLRFGVAAGRDEDAQLAPITVAARRYRVLDLFDRAPLLHAQHGVEIAIATPWIADPDAVPTAALAALYGPDGELADNGWSLRPADWHARADLLICRSWHGEIGAGPELFRSTADDDRALDVGVRWHFSLGVGLACARRRDRFVNDVTVAVQYRARAVLYNRTDGGSYRDTVALSLQYAPRGGHAIGAFAAIDPGPATRDYLMVGLRWQLSLGGPR